MKTLALLIAACTGLAGCVVAPLGGPPGVYIAPVVPTVVVRPYGYGRGHGYGYGYGYDRSPRYRNWR